MVEGWLEKGIIALEDVADLVGIDIPVFSCGIEVLLNGVEEGGIEEGGVEVVAGLEVDVALDQPVLASHEGVEVVDDDLGGPHEVADAAVDQVVDPVQAEKHHQHNCPEAVGVVVDELHLGEGGGELALPLALALPVHPEHRLLVLVYFPQPPPLNYVLPHPRVVVLHLLEELVGDEGEEVEAGLLLVEPEPIVGVDEAAQEEGEGREEGEGADAEVVEEGQGGLGDLLVVEQVVLVEPGHLKEVLGEDFHVLEVEVGGVAPLRLLQFLDHLAGSVEHMLKELIGIQLCCLGGKLPGGGLLDVFI